MVRPRILPDYTDDLLRKVRWLLMDWRRQKRKDRSVDSSIHSPVKRHSGMAPDPSLRFLQPMPTIPTFLLTRVTVGCLAQESRQRPRGPCVVQKTSNRTASRRFASPRTVCDGPSNSAACSEWAEADLPLVSHPCRGFNDDKNLRRCHDTSPRPCLPSS